MRSLPSPLQVQMLLLLLLFALRCTRQQAIGDLIVYHYEDESRELRIGEGTQRRISGISDRTNKDFVLGGLFPIHAEDPNFDGGRCGAIRTDQEIEAMLFALDSINANSELLPNIILGYDIRNTLPRLATGTLTRLANAPTIPNIGATETFAAFAPIDSQSQLSMTIRSLAMIKSIASSSPMFVL